MSFVDKLRQKVTPSNQVNSGDESLETSNSTAVALLLNHCAASPAFENKVPDSPWVLVNAKESLIVADIPVSCNDGSQPYHNKDT